MARISIGSASDVGSREDNEDSLLAIVSQDSSTQGGYTGSSVTGSALLILADGMGGRSHGKVASETATITIYRELAHILALRRQANADYFQNAILKAITKANDKINGLVAIKPDAGGMGTTVAVALVVRDFVCVGHVGDSRAYMLSGDESTLRPLTEDHSLVQDEVRAGRLTMEQARKSKNRNVITRAVGVDTTVDADISVHQIPAGTVAQIVVSSDGMHGSMTEHEIIRVLREHASDPQDAADALISTAKANGAKDNISAVVASVDTRFGSDSYGIIGLDDRPNIIDQAIVSHGLNRRISWLTSANIFAFAIGMVIMGLIGWKFFPPVNVIKQVVVESPLGLSSKAPPTPPEVTMLWLRNADYDSPVTVAKGPFFPTYLNNTSGNIFQVYDATAKQLYSINIITSEGVYSIPNPLDSFLTAVDISTASDIAKDKYVLSQKPPLITKTTPNGTKRQIGLGMLTDPTAIALAPSGDIVVIDNNELKRFVVVRPASSR